MLASRAIALEGVGYASRVLALQGLYEVGTPATRAITPGPWRQITDDLPRPRRRAQPAPLPPPYPPIVLPAPTRPAIEVLAGPGLTVVLEADSPFKERLFGTLAAPVAIEDDELLAIALLVAA